MENASERFEAGDARGALALLQADDTLGAFDPDAALLPSLGGLQRRVLARGVVLCSDRALVDELEAVVALAGVLSDLGAVPPSPAFADAVLGRARTILEALQAHAAGAAVASPGDTPREDPGQLSLFGDDEDPVLRTLRDVKLDQMTPLDAMNLLADLKAKL